MTGDRSDKPLIEIQPMLQGPHIHNNEEDWTGCTNAVRRRKLQNRLNQRASRSRRRLGTAPALSETVPSKAPDIFDDPTSQVQKNNLIAENPTATNLSPSTTNPTKAITKIQRCIDPSSRRSVQTSPDFRTFVARRNIYPLSADHALLTLLHFNLLRALMKNILVLGLNPDHMALDIPSPWIETPGQLSLEKLPPVLHPTPLQLTIPHHPEIDVLPCPKHRDNLILAGDSVDDMEFCCDLIYGVDTELPVLRTCKEANLGGRTGLIVWSDPYLIKSWEVEEGFFRKWKRLFVGCEEVLRWTNYWREKRGEKALEIEI